MTPILLKPNELRPENCWIQSLPRGKILGALSLPEKWSLKEVPIKNYVVKIYCNLYGTLHMLCTLNIKIVT